MKNLIFALAGIMLLLASCAKDEVSNGGNPLVNKASSNNRFYGVKYPENNVETKGIAQRNNLWYPCSKIKVKFLNDPYNMAELVKEYAIEWEEYAGITFDFVTTGDADIRIGFDWNDERYITWSYIGTDCKKVTNQTEATASFAYWDSSTPEEIRGDVLRVFGMVLGLEMEHRHLDFDAGWTSVINKYWEGEVEDIPWASLKKYVFDPLNAADIVQTNEYDENSIMVWPFAKKYAKNTARDFNNELSEKDIEFIQKLYPQDSCKRDDLILTATVYRAINYYIFSIATDKSIRVNLGNGTETIQQPSNYSDYDIRQLGGGIYTIKSYGSPYAIRSILAQGLTQSIDVSNCRNLEILNLLDCFFSDVDLSKNKKLKRVMIGGRSFGSIDVSKNLQLTTLYCIGSPITALDVSKNTLLTDLNTGGCLSLTKLDVSNNKFLTNLVLFSNKSLSTIDVSSNKLLKELSISNNDIIPTIDVSNNPQLTKLSISDMSKLSMVDISNNPLLEALNFRNTNISNWDFSKNVNLKRVLMDNIFTDKAQFIEFIKTLPNRTGTEIGVLLMSSLIWEWYPHVDAEVKAIALEKNWSIQVG